jgi:hypothetical protein
MQKFRTILSTINVGCNETEIACLCRSFAVSEDVMN